MAVLSNTFISVSLSFDLGPLQPKIYLYGR